MNEIRQEFILKSLTGKLGFARLCREYGISRKTGYKWKQRALADGLAGLQEQSRRPKRSPQQMDESTVCALVRLKLRHPHWGAKKLALVYERSGQSAPSISTYQRILTKAGLVTSPRRRRAPVAGRLQTEFVAQAPNDVWTVDFKGWWLLRNGQRCEPLTVRDACTRYVLAVHVPAAATGEAVRECFERLFEQHGLPRVIKSDNGSPFASAHAVLGLSRLSAWWVSLGLQLDRSRPASPQDNGAHERLHRDMAAEIASHVAVDRATQQAACDVWREQFNHERPHEALHGKCPAQLYTRSSRTYQRGPVTLIYGAGFFPRKVACNGVVTWCGQGIFISGALAGCQVGLRRVDTHRFEVWLNYLLLGSLDFQTLSFHGSPSLAMEAQRLSA